MERLPAVILAAGRGKRLGALTKKTPKPLLRIGDKPLLEWILTGLRDAGVQEFLCVIGYLGEQIQGYFGNGERLGVQMSYVWQKDMHGTGAALRLGREFCEGGQVLMSFGDILTHADNYCDLIAEYRKRPCAALMGINYMKDVSAGGAVIREGERVVRIVEKPGPNDPSSNWNQAGVTVFSSAIWPVLERLPVSPRGEYELTSAMNMLIEEGHEVRAVEFHGLWSDVGTPEALEEAELSLMLPAFLRRISP